MGQEVELTNNIVNGLETGKIFVVWNFFINDYGTLNFRRIAAFYYENDAQEFVRKEKEITYNEIFTIEETNFEDIKENILPF